jgi:hypothetical protein
MNDNTEENNSEKNKNAPLKKDENKGGFSFLDSINLFTGIIDFIKCLFK